MRRPKSFDCVEMMHEAGRKVSAMLRRMTPQERADYWRRETEAMRRRQAELRAEAEASGNLTGPSPALAASAGRQTGFAGMTAEEQTAYIEERMEELRRFAARTRAEPALRPTEARR